MRSTLPGMQPTDVLITPKGHAYHRNVACHRYSRGRENSEHLARRLHTPRLVSVAEAQRLGKAACKYCV